jgi:hypothetical protein
MDIQCRCHHKLPSEDDRLVDETDLKQAPYSTVNLGFNLSFRSSDGKMHVIKIGLHNDGYSRASKGFPACISQSKDSMGELNSMGKLKDFTYNNKQGFISDIMSIVQIIPRKMPY